MGYAKATKVTLPTDAFIYTISFYSHTSGNARLAIYSDSSGAPGSRLWQSGDNSVSASSWYSLTNLSAVPSTPLTLNAGTYWLAWQWNSVNFGPSLTYGSAGDGNYMAQTYGSFPSTWSGGTSSDEKWSMYITYRSSKIGANDGNWHYIAIARAGTGDGQLTTYYDGTPVATATDMRTLSNGDSFNLSTSKEDSAVNRYTGYLDEVRLSSTARGASWIATEYNNQNSPSTFHYNMTQYSYSCSGPTGLDLQVGASSDDCSDWGVNSFSLVLANDWVDTLSAGTDPHSSGLRFTGVTVPPGSTITSAYITYRARFTVASPGSGKIYGHDADNPTTFSTWGDYETKYAVKTSAFVQWSPSAWVVDTDYNSPDIKTVIQEIVDRPGWSSGNSLILFVVGDHVAEGSGYAYDSSTTYAPKLHIEYT